MTKEEIQKQIELYKSQLTDDLLSESNLELKERIHNLEMKLNNVEPNCSIDGECLNCGS